MLFAFLALGALFAALTANSVLTSRSISKTAEQNMTNGISGLSALADVLTEIREQRIIVYSYFSAVSPADMTKLEARLAKSKTDLAGYIRAFAAVSHRDLGPQVAGLRTAAAKLSDVNDRVFASRRSGDLPGTLALVKGDAKDASHDTIEAAENLLNGTRALVEKANGDSRDLEKNAYRFTVLLSLVAAAVMVAIWWLIGRSLADPMAKLTEATTRLAGGGEAPVPSLDRGDELGAIARAVNSFRQAAIARADADACGAREQEVVTTALRGGLAALTKGDLTAEITADFPPAYAELKTNFNEALTELRALIGSVMGSTAAIRTGSGEIADASENLARRTEAGAASLERTSAALTQIDERLKTTATAAGSTVNRADQAIATVGGGRAIADEAVQAMDRVSDSARGIDSVIEGVDKIAFQTRVLAMNAAVEAGRAGDAGRGFAVVADLVSALAMRAEEEAKRARDQLSVTQADVVTAVQAVQKVDVALANIAGDVSGVHQLLGTMAADNRAQSSTITEISLAIGTMDQTAQQNAAMVEETSAAARNLASEVNALAERASHFRVDRSTPVSRRAGATSTMEKYLASPAKSLPAAAIPALVRSGGGDDWNEF